MRHRDQTSASPPMPTAASPHVPVPSAIVGIGAAAGGVEALQSFFRTLPESSGAAFVLVAP
ncbi:MAG: hypothetical protein KDK05_20750, partial [Candidatus Competibacteraceae bacterium]|nr:hypothetical protein [Candidatus Competibacteraceae bacterium]